MKSDDEGLQALNSDEWFASLDPACRQSLLVRSNLVSVPKGGAVWHRQDRSNGLYCLLSGSVHVTTTSWGGRELLVSVVYPVNWFGEVSVLDGGGRTHEVIAVSDSRLLHVPKDVLELACSAHPALWRNLAQLMAAKLRNAYACLEEVCLLPASARLASRLLSLLYQDGSMKSSGKIPLQQEDLAMMLSLSRQTVNKTLNELEQAGAIAARYGVIQVVDEQLLRRFAER